MNTVHKIIAVYLALLLPFWARTQVPGLLERIEDNPEITTLRLAEEEARLGIELAGAARRPTVDMRSDYLLSAGGRRIDIPIGTLLNPVYGTLNRITGTEDFPVGLANVDERFLPSNFHDSRVEVRLPLLQPLIAREEALRRSQLDEATAATAVAENQLRLQVRSLYYAYQQSLTGLAIVDSSRAVLQELLRVNEILVRNDKATRDVVYRTEAELAALDGRTAKLSGQATRAAAALNRLLARDITATVPTDTVERNQNAFALPNYTASRDRALNRRPELRQIDAGRESLRRLEALQLAEGRPSLGLSLQAGAQGFLAGDWSDHPYALLGVGLSWNLYDGNRRRLRAQQTQLQREQLRLRRDDTERAIDLEVLTATNDIATARARLTAARAAVRASREAARLIERRYRNEQALLVEYLDARNRLTTAELEENLAYYQLLTALAELNAATGA